jgi:hypothetical protein
MILLLIFIVSVQIPQRLGLDWLTGFEYSVENYLATFISLDLVEKQK